jgi:hypothetical protein
MATNKTLYMNKILALPYKGYEILVYRDSTEYSFRISNHGMIDNIFYFSVPLVEILQPPYDEGLFEDEIQICKDHIDIITKEDLAGHRF